MKKRHLGFTLLEVIVFVTIFAVFFVTAAYVVTVSIRAMQFNVNKIIATHLAQEALEWTNGQKEADWSAFTPRASGTVGGATDWCFNQSSISGWPSSGPCLPNDYSLNGLYKRNLRLILSSSTQVTAQVSVSWQEGGHIYTVPLNIVFSVYE